MIIGLDIDNVISDFDSRLFKEFLTEDKKKRSAGVVNPNGAYFEKMFDWSKEEVDEFYNSNMEEIAKTLNLRKGAKKYTDKLLADGHKLILISHRVFPHYKEPYQTTANWLKMKGINYSQLVLSKEADKSDECKKLGVDIMFDDRQTQCKKMQENGVNCYLMLAKYNRDNRYNLPYAQNWKHVYEIVCELDNQKGKS